MSHTTSGKVATPDAILTKPGRLCDGVLVDSEPIAVRVDLIVLAQFGLTLTQSDVIKRFVGRSPHVMLEVIEAHIGHRL